MWVPRVAAALHQSLLAQDVKGFQPDRRGERISAERRAVRARREDIHDLPGGDEGRDREHSPAKRLAEDQPVGPGVLMLEGEPGTGASEPRLHLIEDQQHVVRVAQVAEPCEKPRGRNDDAGLTLDRLHQHGDRVGRDRPLDGGEVTKGDAVEAGREGSEAIAIVGLRGERDDGRGTAVKIDRRRR
jgi:hypothetical protein